VLTTAWRLSRLGNSVLWVTSMNSSVPVMRRLADSDEGTSFANKLRASIARRFRRSGLSPAHRCRDSDSEHRRRRTTTTREHQAAHLRRDESRSVSRAEDRYSLSRSAGEDMFRFEPARNGLGNPTRQKGSLGTYTKFFFPMEPRFHFIGWQRLPLAVHASILQR